jgi:hypothetical protein
MFDSFYILNDRDQNITIEKRDEVTFKNGAKYSGEWLGNKKYGFGI